MTNERFAYLYSLLEINGSDIVRVTKETIDFINELMMLEIDISIEFIDSNKEPLIKINLL